MESFEDERDDFGRIFLQTHESHVDAYFYDKLHLENCQYKKINSASLFLQDPGALKITFLTRRQKLPARLNKP